MKSAKDLLADELECLQSLLEIRELDSNPDYWDENETPTNRAKYRAELEARISTTKKHIETLEKVVELSELTKQFGHSAN
jgi:hypothetical protein